MSFVPQEELSATRAQSLAPMIDFLFLMLMFFATLAISRITTRETEIDLVEIRPEAQQSRPTEEARIVNLMVSREGQYKWVTDLQDYPFDTAEAVANELLLQQERGTLPKESSATEVLLRIDKEAQWEPILRLLFAVRDAGFPVHPIYLPEGADDI